MVADVQQQLVADPGTTNETVYVPQAAIVARADALAWEHALKACDAVQLACALWWRDSADEEAVFGTFDRHLWEAAVEEGMLPLPEGMLPLPEGMVPLPEELA